MTQFGNKRSLLILLFIGAVDLIRDYLKRDSRDAVFVFIAFFVICSILSWWIGRESAN